MFKKITLTVLFTGFIGILVWGGVNRTLAKSNDSEFQNANNQNVAHEDNNGNVDQQRGNGNKNQGKDTRNEGDESVPADGSYLQTDTSSQGQSSRDGF